MQACARIYVHLWKMQSRKDTGTGTDADADAAVPVPFRPRIAPEVTAATCHEHACYHTLFPMPYAVPYPVLPCPVLSLASVALQRPSLPPLACPPASCPSCLCPLLEATRRTPVPSCPPPLNTHLCIRLHYSPLEQLPLISLIDGHEASHEEQTRTLAVPGHPRRPFPQYPPPHRSSSREDAP